MAIHRFQTPDGKIHRVEAPSRDVAEAELGRVMKDQEVQPSANTPFVGAMPVLGDLWKAGEQAVGAVKAQYDRQVAAAKPGAKRSMVDDLMSVPRMAGALMQFPGAITEAVTRPVARAAAAAIPGTNAADNNDILNTALMGLRPSAARLAPFAEVRPPPKMPGIPVPQAKAARYVQKIVKSGGDIGALDAAPADITAAEALGRSGKVGLGALARRQGETGDALDAVVADRQLGRADRILGGFTDATGVSPEAAAGDISGIVKRGRENAAPLYDEAYAVGGVNTPQLDVLVNRPSIRGAMSRAMNIAAEEGRDPHELGFRLVKRAGEPQMVERTVERPSPVGGMMETRVREAGLGALEDHHVQVENPSAQTWDYVKRGLDDVLETYRDKTTGRLNLDEQGKAVLETLNHLRGELTTANPAYGKALGESSDYLSARDAFGKGEKFLFNGNVTERQFADHIGSLSGAQQDAFRGGIGNKLFDLAQNGRLEPKLFKAPRVQAKLRMALGDEGAGQLLDLLSHEGNKLGFERRYAPGANSITSEMRAAMAEQDELGSMHQAMDDFITNVHRGPVAAIGSAAAGAVKKGAAIARTPGMPVDVRDEAGRLLMMSPQDLAAHLRSLPPPKPLLDARGRKIVGRVGYVTEGLPRPVQKRAR